MLEPPGILIMPLGEGAIFKGGTQGESDLEMGWWVFSPPFFSLPLGFKVYHKVIRSLTQSKCCILLCYLWPLFLLLGRLLHLVLP